MPQIQSNTAARQVAVVIPLYKPQLDADEQISLKQCLAVLGHYPICFVRPEHSVFDYDAQLENYGQQTFSADYFRSVQDYNRLMMSPDFYAAFSGYEYILIHQLDAFVFEDKLSHWCGLNYDYVGAPWLKPGIRPKPFNTVKTTVKGWLHRRLNILDKQSGLPSEYQQHNQVGNGGFSLRKVARFREIALEQQDRIAHYLAQTDHRFNEDVFWGIEVNRQKRRLKIPNVFTALEFAVENRLEKAFLMLGNKRPFGCHAWNLHKPFWRETFARLGYHI